MPLPGQMPVSWERDRNKWGSRPLPEETRARPPRVTSSPRRRGPSSYHKSRGLPAGSPPAGPSKNKSRRRLLERVASASCWIGLLLAVARVRQTALRIAAGRPGDAKAHTLPREVPRRH